MFTAFLIFLGFVVWLVVMAAVSPFLMRWIKRRNPTIPVSENERIALKSIYRDKQGNTNYRWKSVKVTHLEPGKGFVE